MAVSKQQILQSAEKYLSKGKLDQALKEYLRLLDENPKDVATLNRVGDLLVRMNRPGDAIQYFTRIADSYSRDGFFLKAIAIYKRINKIDPARLDVYEKLADLYHKQGLTQDARSQYQVLADHYQKSGRHDDAIAAYKKMASVDPNDLKIQVRLADLYRTHKQTEQAVMQYGLIGSMLLRRGAHDEAAAVFQKALELSPHDAGIQRSLVKSLIAQKNAAAAIAILKAAPRTPDSLALLAEAQLELGHRSDAVKTAEQGLALDAKHEPSRGLISRIRILEGSFEQAFAAIAPAVEGAIAARDFPRAAGHLSPILDAEPAHRPSLEKMAEVREAEGNAAEAAALRIALGREAERRGDMAAAVANYQRALKSQPGNLEALERLKRLGAEAPPVSAIPPPFPKAEERKPVEPLSAFGVQELVVDFERPAPPASTAPPITQTLRPVPPASSLIAPPAPAAPPAAVEEQEIETLVVEAEVFAKYGLTDKAIERLRSLVRRRPDLTQARERLVDLMGESKNPALLQEAESLADVYRRRGRADQADALLARLGLSTAAPAPEAPSVAAPAQDRPPTPLTTQQTPLPAPSPQPAAQTSDVAFDEFEIELSLPPSSPARPAEETPAAPPPEPPSFAAAPMEEQAKPPAPIDDFETIRFSRSDVAPVAESIDTAAFPLKPIAPLPPMPTDSEFVSYEELGSLLEDEMQKASEPLQATPPPPAVDEKSLFADEQQFFNLAEELEKELSEEIPSPPEAPAMTGLEGEASLEEIFREFKKGVEQQLSAEDYETHFNLGIAYKEMGLIDEAIGEFQLASKDAGRMVECCSMLGLCFLEKGMPQLAIKWYRKGLEASDIKEVETVGLLYDLGCVYQSTGEVELAYKTFLEVYGLNTNYRDIVHRVKDLEAVKRT